ncbi:hypothetical protein CTRI78_v004294 [Colletotrichum trifolii]|uniref:Uncharacterized protein n=1 Tax=Colletotrichum trifolii TaxID=5466 RepID=A0A4R8RLY7_COLTR|nr:hypothetical protein CTRI78_v004294 [Colletotrichum trifolii]
MKFLSLVSLAGLISTMASASPTPESPAASNRRWTWNPCYEEGTQCTNSLGGVGGCSCGLGLDPNNNCVCV